MRVVCILPALRYQKRSPKTAVPGLGGTHDWEIPGFGGKFGYPNGPNTGPRGKNVRRGPQSFVQSEFPLSLHRHHITPDNATREAQRHLSYCQHTVYLVFRSLIGALMIPSEAVVDDLGRNMLQFSPKQGSTSLRLRVMYQPVIEGFMVRCYSLDTGLWGKVQSSHSFFPQSPVRKHFSYRVVGEEIPCSQGSIPGLGGRNTGLEGKWYRASGEIFAQFYLQIKQFFRSSFVPCLKSV